MKAGNGLPLPIIPKEIKRNQNPPEGKKSLRGDMRFRQKENDLCTLRGAELGKNADQDLDAGKIYRLIIGAKIISKNQKRWRNAGIPVNAGSILFRNR